jgi:SAM-dependent methyltransferase
MYEISDYDRYSRKKENHLMKLYGELNRITQRPEPFEFYTSPLLWNDPHISKGMLEAHFDSSNDAASYRSEFIDKAVEWMCSRFSISEGTSICDFGCGPGQWTTRFAERGAQVTGVDLSERSLQYARNAATMNGLEIEYIQHDYLEFDPQTLFDLVVMISQDFSVLSPAQRQRMLQTVQNSLADGRTVLLDVSSMQYLRNSSEGTRHEFHPNGGFMSPHPHHAITTTFIYEPECVVCDKIVVIEQDREFEIYTWVQCYSLETIGKVSEESGLEIVEYYADIAGASLKDDSPAIAVVARRSV